MPRPFRVTRLGSSSLERLRARQDGQGRVHSVFDRAVNILWPDGMLLTLHGPAPLAAPFAVALDQMPPRGTVTPAMVIQASDFDWTQSEIVALDMPPGSLGFDPGALPEPPGGHALASGAGLGARHELSGSLATRDLATFADAAWHLIGLGEGLTPAGDDYVVGALAAIHRLAPDWFTADRTARDRLAEAARSRTTDVARDFLLEALEGRFAQPVLALLTARSDQRADRAARDLLAMGATSGADTLGGIRLACRALATPSPVIA